ncbi:MAG: DUF3784 domain-containing protein [Rikenellaceae bacterium]
MVIFWILFGLLFIGLGRFIERNPNSLSGYNTMKSDKKDKVDIVPMVKLIKKFMFAIGGAVIIGALLGFLLCIKLELVSFFLIEVIIVGMAIAIFAIQRYDHNEYSWVQKCLGIIIMIGFIVIVTLAMWNSLNIQLY